MTEQPVTGRGAGSVRPPAGPHVVIIGGGASGVLMAVHLLMRQDCLFRVTLIEGRNIPGQGLAYATQDPGHLLNTRVQNMSAFPGDPDHFLRWLQSQPSAAPVTPACFVSRAVYGRYLAQVLAPFLTGPAAARLRVVPDMALSLQDDPRGVILRVSGGQSIIGDIAILATGHVPERPHPQAALVTAWDDAGPIDPHARVVLIGTGLSMVDRAISLLKAGHSGEILALSRRGLLPRPHAPTSALSIGLAEVPLGAPLSQLMRWLRDLARRAEAAGGTWRDAVDGIRPHVRAIWRGMPAAERARFLRHGAAWWDVHRHRNPPASAAVIAEALASGQMRLLRGAFLGADRTKGAGVRVSFRPHGSRQTMTLDAALAFDCRGIRRDLARHAGPLIRGLLASGAARIDPLNIGLDVDQASRVITASGQTTGRLYAIGPVARAAFWEITAVPDIRDQTHRLAAALAGARAGS